MGCFLAIALNDSFHEYTFDGASRINPVDSRARQVHVRSGRRSRARGHRRELHRVLSFWRNVLAEQDQTGNWTDYIYASGKRIAKADLFDTRLHVTAAGCSRASFPTLG
jgi:hypothetical protein